MVFWGRVLKTQIVSICAKIVFSQNCRNVKDEGFRKEMDFLFLFFFMLLQEKQKKNYMDKSPKNSKK